MKMEVTLGLKATLTMSLSRWSRTAASQKVMMTSEVCQHGAHSHSQDFIHF